MTRPERDEVREERIAMEATVDAYDETERALGWYYYLEDRLAFPFRARCASERATSPLGIGDEVEVTGMAPEEDCEREMLVTIPWGERRLAVPLSQLEPLAVDEGTEEAAADWRYWVAVGHRF